MKDLNDILEPYASWLLFGFVLLIIVTMSIGISRSELKTENAVLHSDLQRQENLTSYVEASCRDGRRDHRQLDGTPTPNGLRSLDEIAAGPPAQPALPEAIGRLHFQTEELADRNRELRRTTDSLIRIVDDVKEAKCPGDFPDKQER